MNSNLFCGYVYNKAIRHLWEVAKHQGYSEIAYHLGRLWAKDIMQRHEILEALLVSDCIVPVPLSAEKLQHRGFNQVVLLCWGLADELKLISGVELKISNAFSRTRDTKTQIGMNKASRQLNLAKAFQLNSDLLSRQAYSTIIVVDDVLTTGTTFAECVTEASQAGVDIAGCLAFAGQ